MREFEGCMMSESKAKRLENILGMIKGIPYENLDVGFDQWCKGATSISASHPLGKIDRADFQGLLRFVEEKVVRPRSWAHDEFIVFVCRGDRKFSKENCFFAIFELFNALHYTESLKNLDLHEYKHHFGIGYVLSNLGVMYCDNTLYEKAQECFKLAQNCFEQEQDYLCNIAANLNLAALGKVLGHYQQGRQFCVAAIKCLYEHHSDIEIGNGLLQVLTRVVYTAEELEVENKEVQDLLNKIIYILSQHTAFLDTELTCLTRQLMIIKLKEKSGESIPFKELGRFIDAVCGFLKHSDEKHSPPVDFIKAVVTVAKVSTDMKEACHLLNKVERVFLQALGANHQLAGFLLSQTGSFYLGIGQITNANIALHQAIDILVASLGWGHPKVAACQLSLGTCAISKGETREASRLLNEALSTFKRINPEHPQVAETFLKLAEVYAEEGKKTKARETMEQALCIVESVCGEVSFKTAGSFIQAGGILKMGGISSSSAIDHIEKAISILSKLKVGLSHPDMQLCHSFLGAMQRSMGKTQAAVETLTKALHGGLSKTYVPAVKAENVGGLYKMRCEEGFFSLLIPPLVSLVSLVHLTTGDKFDKHFVMLTRWLQEHRPNNLQVMDFSGNLFTIISHVVHPCWYNVFLAISSVPVEKKPLTGESWDSVSYPKIFMHGPSQINENKKPAMFFFVSDVHQEVMETVCLERAFRESVDILFMQPKFRKVFKNGKPLHLDLTPSSVPSLCQLIDSIPFLVECEVSQSYEESFVHDCPSACHMAAQNSVQVLYYTFKFSEQNEVQFVFDNIVSELPSDSALGCPRVSLVKNVAFFHLQDPKNCLVSLVHKEDCIVLRYHFMPGEGNSSNSSSLVIKEVKGIVDSVCDLMGVKYDFFAGHNCEKSGVNNLHAEDTSSGYSSMEVEGRSVCSTASSKIESDEDNEDNECLDCQQQDGLLLMEKLQLETPALKNRNENANSLELGICISLLESLVTRRCRQKEVTRVTGLSDVKDDSKEVLNSSLLSVGSASSLNSLPEFPAKLGDESPTSCTVDVVFKDDDCASESSVTNDTRGIVEETLLKENHAFGTQLSAMEHKVSELRDQVRVLEQQVKYAELEKTEILNELGRHLVYEAREKRRKGITVPCTFYDPDPEHEISQRHTVSFSHVCPKTGNTLLSSWSAGQEENSATQDESEPCRFEGSAAVMESAHRRFPDDPHSFTEMKIRDIALYLSSETHGNERKECFSEFSTENRNMPINEEMENDPLSISEEKNAKQVSHTPSSSSDDSIQLYADTASSVTAEHVESARLNLRPAPGSTTTVACYASAIAESSHGTCGQQFRNLESDKSIEDEIPDPGLKVSEAKDGRTNQLIWNADRKIWQRNDVASYGSLQGDMHDPKDVDFSRVQDAQVEDHDTGSLSVVEVQRSNGIRVLPFAESGMVLGVDNPVMSRVQAESVGDQLRINVQHNGGTEVPGEVREELTQKCLPQSEESCTASESVCVVHSDRCQVVPSCLPSVVSPAASATTKSGGREHGHDKEAVGDAQRPKENGQLWNDTCDGFMERRISPDDSTESNVTLSRNEGAYGTLSAFSSLKGSSFHERSAFTCKGNASLEEEWSDDVTTVTPTTATEKMLPEGDGSYAGEASLPGYWHRLGARPRERCSIQGQQTHREHSPHDEKLKGQTAGFGVANAFLALHSEDENLHHSLQQRSTDDLVESEHSTLKESDLDTLETASSGVQLSCGVESHGAFGGDIPAPVGFPCNHGRKGGCEDSIELGHNPGADIYTPFQPVYEPSPPNSGLFARPIEDHSRGSDYPAADYYCPLWNPTNNTASVPVPYGDHTTSITPYVNVGQSDLTSGIFSSSTSRSNPDYMGSYAGASWWRSPVLPNGAAYDDNTSLGSVESNQLYSSARGSSPMLSTDSEQTVPQVVSRDCVEIGTMTDDSVYVNGDFESCAAESPATADVSLLALEQRVAEACALMERVLREREEREQIARERERRERELREIREREAREREASSRRDQQEAITGPPQWLCEHYQRHCRVRFPCCEQFYSCHRCHNGSDACSNDEAKANHATHMKCSRCNHVQEINETSQVCANCKRKVSAYFCAICKHFTSVDKNPYHCDKCGICRIHKDRSFHCKVCDVCLDKRLLGNHKCRPDSGHDECCICLEDAFSGCQILPCSHKVHRECAVAMIQNGVRNCPICRQSLYTPTSNSRN